MEMKKMMQVVDQVSGIMIDLSEYEFMTIMCMLYDEYHDKHRESDPVKMSQECASLVAEINQTLGAYENV